MGLLAIFKEGNDLEGAAEEKRMRELKAYITEIEGQLELDYSRRLNGDGTYSGYETLRQFYKGRQWSHRKEGGGTMRTYNYLFTIVENMTAFLTNEPPQMSCPPRKLDDPVERALAEGRSRLLEAVHEENSLPLVFQRAGRTGSLCGDAFIFGPIPTFKTNEEGEREFDGIRYWNIEKPETVRIVWKDDNYNEIAGFIKQYRINVAVAKKLFAEQIKKTGLIIEADGDVQPSASLPPSNQPMVTIKEWWDDQEYMLMLNSNNKIAYYEKHEWGFVPLQWIPNIHIPGEMKGTSDIEHELDAQQEYNERTCDLADVIKEMATPSYWGKNIDNMSEIRSGKTVIYSFGDDGEINAMPKNGQTFPIENYLKDRKDDIIGLSGLNQVLYPGSHTMQSTGRALSVIMQGVNNKIALRKEWWIKAFKEINKGILYHAEQYIPGAKAIIGQYYQSDVFISSVLLRSVSDEINKFQAKVQSLTTTQHNVGVPNPSEEQKLMKEELQDDILAVEISKQPALLHQIIAERMAAAAESQGGPEGSPEQQQVTPGMGISPGGPQVQGQPPAIATEANNAPGQNPTPSRGVASPVNPNAAIQQMASRTGAKRTVK